MKSIAMRKVGLPLPLRRVYGFWRQFSRDRVALISLVVLLACLTLAIAAPWLPISDPMAFEHEQYQPPSRQHLMGTDNFGRSVLSRVIWGTRLALTIGVVSAGIAMTFGITLGALSGYFGGWIDDVLSRIFDVFLLIPSFLLALLMVALFGPNIIFVMLVIGITRWPRSARVMRAQVLTLKSRTYVKAARVSGASHAKALFLHIIPNGLAPVLTHGTILMGSAILTEAGLSFLGMGDPNTVSWGRMIFDGQQHLRVAPWMSIFPGIAMLIVVCALNLIGDGLNYAVNPQLRERTVPRGMELPKLSPRSTDSTAAEPSEPSDLANEPQLDIRDLTMYYAIESGWVRAVDGVSLKLGRGQSVGLAGESGCGKTSVGIAIMRVLPSNARILGGSVLLDGREILQTSEEVFKKVRWTEISMIFQSAMNALNPVKTVGSQLTEAYKLHRPRSNRSEALDKVKELFDIVGIPRDRAGSYPHELSGGMRQRVMISLALLLEPKVIIADEPTTALDVLVQDQILAEMERLKKQMNLSFVLISHDIGVLAETCDQIAVMYAGQIVEQAHTRAILTNPRHPYTSGLLGSLPRLTGPRIELVTLPGESTVMVSEPQGCRFAPRCPLATEFCRTITPELIAFDTNHTSRCHYALTAEVETAWQDRRPPNA